MAKQIDRKDLKEMSSMLEQGTSVKEISKIFRYPERLVRGSLADYMGRNTFMKLTRGYNRIEEQRVNDGIRTVEMAKPVDIMPVSFATREDDVEIEGDVMSTTFEDEDPKEAEKEVDETVSEDNSSGRNGQKYSDDDILAVAEAFEGGMPISRIADSFEMSAYSVRKILEDFFGKRRFNSLKKKNTKNAKIAGMKKYWENKVSGSDASNEEKPEESVSKKPEVKKSNATSNLIKLPNKKSLVVRPLHRQVQAGLFKDRHDMPTKKYIFGHGIPSDKISDYEFMNRTINEFISENINFVKGVPEVGLGIYVTGFQPALAELMRVCTERKINLTLFHHDLASGKYNMQIINEQYPQVYKEVQKPIQGLSRTADEMYIVEMSDDEFRTKKDFYDVNIIKRPNGDPMVNTIYFTKSLEDAYTVFMCKSMECLEIAQSHVTGYNMYIHYNKLDSESWMSRKNLQISNIDGTTETTEFYCRRTKEANTEKEDSSSEA